MRDEEMALRDEEVTGELPEDLNTKSLTRSANSWRRSSKNNLPCTKPDKCRWILVWWYANICHSIRVRHFDVARIVIDQAVRLGVAQADFTGLPAKWQPINDYGAKVQAHVIDKY